MTADQAIIFVRASDLIPYKLGDSCCVREFISFWFLLLNIFSCCDPKAHAVTLAQYLIRQRHLLHGYEARLLKHIPKIIHLVCKLLLDLAENRPVVTEEVADIPGLSAEVKRLFLRWSQGSWIRSYWDMTVMHQTLSPPMQWWWILRIRM